MTSFIIKIIAVITMLCDHSGDLIIGHISTLNMIGRIAFPLFAFQLVIGYAHTSNLKKYLFRLFVFALISEIPFSIFMHIISGSYFGLNIFFTLFLGVCAMYIYDNCFSNDLKIINNTANLKSFYLFRFLKTAPVFFKIMFGTFSMSIIFLFAYFLKVDYSIWGIVLILYIHIFYDKNKVLFSIGYLILCLYQVMIYYGILSYQWLISDYIFTILPLTIMLLYNGKKGPSLQNFFYIFYPLHLIILELIHFTL